MILLPAFLFSCFLAVGLRLIVMPAPCKNFGDAGSSKWKVLEANLSYVHSQSIFRVHILFKQLQKLLYFRFTLTR